MTRSRVHHQPWRLVDHDQRGVLVEDIERDRLGLGPGRGGGGQCEGKVAKKAGTAKYLCAHPAGSWLCGELRASGIRGFQQGVWE